MALIFCLALLCLTAAVTNAVDMSVECGEDSVTARWPMGVPYQQNIDPSLVRLGYCSPISMSVIPGSAQVVFEFKGWRCGAEMMALNNHIVWSSELTYNPESSDVFLLQTVVCTYRRPHGWTAPTFTPVIETYGTGELIFNMSVMNDDFSGPAVSGVYQLGSLIPISASVNEEDHQPLLVLLDECVASTEPELGPNAQIYSLITNKGCFVDSRKTLSSFLPRQKSSEIRLYLQAFAFALEKEVYIHCKLVAWDEVGFNTGKKACHYNNGGWELLDDPAQSSVCSCCDYGCQSRRRRGIGGNGMAKNAVIGPLVIVNHYDA